MNKYLFHQNSSSFSLYNEFSIKSFLIFFCFAGFVFSENIRLNETTTIPQEKLVKKVILHPNIKKLEQYNHNLIEKQFNVHRRVKKASEIDSWYEDDDVKRLPNKNRTYSNKKNNYRKSYIYPTITKSVETRREDREWYSDIYNYNDENTEYYLSGGTAGDEWGVWFQSSYPNSSLSAVEFQFFQNSGGGIINLNVMEAGTVLPDTITQGSEENNYEDADSIAVADIFGDNLLGPDVEIPMDIQATTDWERITLTDLGYEIDVDNDIFWVHWTKTGDTPMIMADDDNPGDYLHTWSFEPVQDGDEKWSHYGASVGIEAMVRCEVVYPEWHINIQAYQQNDTYRTDAVTVTASASDNALDPALEGIASGNLVYSVNGGDLVTVAATVTGD
ncbi:MAG: hypothetical protein HQ509_03205, partial [Candidatus Marinimicrobia bacterium]|nr:hypothetical protein [Candidatus Neomarinimicrobiota bacterium]